MFLVLFIIAIVLIIMQGVSNAVFSYGLKKDEKLSNLFFYETAAMIYVFIMFVWGVVR